MMDLPLCPGDAPFHHSLGAAPRPIPVDYCLLWAGASVGFLWHILFLFTLLISIGMNNIVSSLQMRMLDEKQKNLWVEHPLLRPLLVFFSLILILWVHERWAALNKWVLPAPTWDPWVSFGLDKVAAMLWLSHSTQARPAPESKGLAFGRLPSQRPACPSAHSSFRSSMSIFRFPVLKEGSAAKWACKRKDNWHHLLESIAVAESK